MLNDDEAGVSGREIIVAVDPEHIDGGKGVGEQATEVAPEWTPSALHDSHVAAWYTFAEGSGGAGPNGRARPGCTGSSEPVGFTVGGTKEGSRWLDTGCAMVFDWFGGSTGQDWSMGSDE